MNDNVKQGIKSENVKYGRKMKRENKEQMKKENREKNKKGNEGKKWINKIVNEK